MWLGAGGVVVFLLLCVFLVLAGALLALGDEPPSSDDGETPVSEETTSPAEVTSAVIGQPGVEETAEVESIPAVEATDTPDLLVYRLFIAKNGEDSLYLMNTSQHPLPLENIRLGDEEDGLSGEEWELERLPVNECVAVWKSSGQPKPPNLNCEPMGERLERSPRDAFWKETFTVYFEGERVGDCSADQSECEITFPISLDD